MKEEVISGEEESEESGIKEDKNDLKAGISRNIFDSIEKSQLKDEAFKVTRMQQQNMLNRNLTSSRPSQTITDHHAKNGIFD